MESESLDDTESDKPLPSPTKTMKPPEFTSSSSKTDNTERRLKKEKKKEDEYIAKSLANKQAAIFSVKVPSFKASEFTALKS